MPGPRAERSRSPVSKNGVLAHLDRRLNISLSVKNIEKLKNKASHVRREESNLLAVYVTDEIPI